MSKILEYHCQNELRPVRSPFQVFMLDSQLDDYSKRTKNSHRAANEEDDQRSYVFVLSSVENKEKPENADR